MRTLTNDDLFFNPMKVINELLLEEAELQRHLSKQAILDFARTKDNKYAEKAQQHIKNIDKLTSLVEGVLEYVRNTN